MVILDPIQKDEEKLFIFIAVLQKKGSALAQFRLGICYRYENGGIKYIEKKIVKWYSLAANLRHAIAQYNLGLYYEYGRGGLAREESATVWL